MIIKEDIIYDPTIPEFSGYHCRRKIPTHFYLPIVIFPHDKWWRGFFTTIFYNSLKTAISHNLKKKLSLVNLHFQYNKQRVDHRLKILMNHKWDLYNVQKVNKNNKRKKYKKIYNNVKSSLKYNVRCRFIIYINLQPARQRVI